MDSKQALLRRNWKTADQKVSLLPILVYDLKDNKQPIDHSTATYCKHRVLLYSVLN